MSKKRNASEGMLSTLLGMIFAAMVLCIPVLMKAMLHPFKTYIWRQLRLEGLCLNWTTRRWLYLPAQWTMPIAFAYCSFQAISHFRLEPATLYPGFIGILYAIGMLLCTVAFNAIHWIEQHFHTPAFQKKLAGRAAENHVKKLVHDYQRRLNASRSLHGVLFVFHPGTDREFSAEADHLLITERNIFVIETKYKSGTISAMPHSSHWEVISRHGTDSMQNALKQAKNTARVLKHQYSLPCKPIPLVAIQGNDVRIVDGPSNVVRAENLLAVIDAFESAQSIALLNPVEMAERLSQYVSQDRAAQNKHIARAQSAQRRREVKSIVANASVDEPL